MLVLMNSAMMPHEGDYRMVKIAAKDFFREIREAKTDKIRSYIGYTENIRLIKENTGIDIVISKENTILEPGDIILVMKLIYRPENKRMYLREKAAQLSDFEFFRIFYNPDRMILPK